MEHSDKKPYVQPTLEKREQLTEVAEGPVMVISQPLEM